MKTALLLLSLSTFVIINQQEEWSKEEQTTFISNCIEGAKTGMDEKTSTDYCSCMLEKMMSNYSSLEASSKITIGEIQVMASDCTGIQLDEDSIEDEWTQVEKDNFISGCVETAKINLEEKVAVQHCNCILEKIIEKYSTPKKSLNLNEEEVQILYESCLE